MTDSTKDQNLAYESAAALARLYASGDVSPVEATKAALARIDAHNDAVNAFCFVDREGAPMAARASAERWRRGEPRSAIDGIPTTVKDVALVEGWNSSFGSRVIALGSPAEFNSPCVDRLLEAGAVLLGLTATPEIGWKGVTDNTRYGITRNPWNTDLTPGGSSGGAAAAAALGMGCLHIGTDGGGSVRIPAGFTGIFAHKPSFGRVAAHPPSPYSTLAHIGPMARSVDDAARMLTVISGADPRDWHALPESDTDFSGALNGFSGALNGGVKGLRVAYSPTLGYADVDREVAALVDKAAKTFEQLGAIVEEVDPGFTSPVQMFEILWFGSVAAKLRGLSAEERQQLDPGLLEIVEKGERIDLLDFIAATVERAEFGAQVNLFHQNYDLLLTPTLPIPAFKAGQAMPDPASDGWWADWTPFTYPFNLTQQPACSVPCGMTSEGLPVGLQIVGRKYDDIGVLTAAKAFEAVYAPPMPTAPVVGERLEKTHNA